ncbi:MAG: RNA polymerase factor sigma-54 [Verrucomicrobia bacterium]|nr:RNA polymerase factor sigma-54 [Verrucomicrobiota bacterium]
MHLSQRMALSQALAPQLQQSLALLQAPTLELKALVEQELAVNPVLEEVASPDGDGEENSSSSDVDEPVDSADLTEPPADLHFDPATEKPTSEPVDDFQAQFERLAQIDQEWRDNLSQTVLPQRFNAEDEERRQFMFDSLAVETSLQETLLEQVRTADLTAGQCLVAEIIIGNIDDYGHLQSSVDELAFSTNVDAGKIHEVLKVIQGFHPPGVGARNLRECLMLQLERADKTRTLDYQIIEHYMEALGKRRLPEIARGLDLSVQEVQDAVERISHLEPRPGRDFLPNNQQYILPEVFVQKVGDKWVVSTNNDQVPQLRISNTYKDMMAQAESSAEVREYIREKIRAGKFLIKSLHQRQQTILNIAREIVKRQSDFMENGVAFLRPMTMVQIAEVVGVHETTVSRAVSGKYMQTPRGLVEMKYFFTAGIKTSSGEGMSNTSVKDLISEMIGNEDSSKPLSDDVVVKQLGENGIQIARRTIAKYRSELNILPSHLRKVY